MSTTTFAELGVSSATTEALAKKGIREPFAIQELVIGDLLAGHDVLAKSPTGSGKTLAFGVPMVDRIRAEAQRPAGLVLAPTRELAVQIVDELRPLAHARALRITAVYGGVGLHEQGRKAARSHIIVACPGRLLDQLNRGAFTLDAVSCVVLDEADRMLDMGFRPDVERILKQTPANRQTSLFSATLDGEVGKLAAKYTRNPKSHRNTPVEAAPRIEHGFRPVEHDTKIDSLVEELSNEVEGLTIVFTRTKYGADKVAKKLSKQGIDCDAMHGNKSQSQRSRALKRFTEGRIAALVATDVAARGIDVRGITRVINFDPPATAEDYTHRSGRTARAGRSGIAISFVRPNDVEDFGVIARQIGLEDEFRAAGFEVRGGGGSVGAGRLKRGGKPAGSSPGRNGQKKQAGDRGDGAGGNGPRPDRKKRQRRRGERGTQTARKPQAKASAGAGRSGGPKRRQRAGSGRRVA